MRDWRALAEQLETSKVEVLVVTAEPMPSLERGVRKHKLEGVRFTRIEPSDWQSWGVANPARPSLPHPGSVVIAPDGQIVFVETHEDYKQRTPPARVIEVLEAHRSSVAPSLE